MKRKAEGYIPRVAAVHDLCGYGKCSLGIAIPVLSAAGCDVCPVPTAVFSNHTAFQKWFAHDVTYDLQEYIHTWDEIGIDIDVIYSGFLGDEKQVHLICELYKRYPKALRVVDPVMADHGKVYPTYTPELCQAMAKLSKKADILTPNLTEATIILGYKWHGSNIEDAEAEDILTSLLDKNAKNVVLKGIHRENNTKILNFIGHEKKGEITIQKTQNNYIDCALHGTGDLFCSTMLAAILNDNNLYDATVFASDLIAEAIPLSAKQPEYNDRGVSFEPLMGKITELYR
ncbi:MAG: bifunctional hydroxymethylpyrimidine kinase/phosphomethylpyrimidine kinase [Eggerthellaceae bacterium]|nr:bifunctional hydroxymethylpyrimidine kinase/phosphomethylpyrimidine kinase [Eggerthellaceae bacterium]